MKNALQKNFSFPFWHNWQAVVFDMFFFQSDSWDNEVYVNWL